MNTPTPVKYRLTILTSPTVTLYFWSEEGLHLVLDQVRREFVYFRVDEISLVTKEVSFIATNVPEDDPRHVLQDSRY